MALTSVAATAVPLLLGHLVDGVKQGSEQQLAHDALFGFATYYLLAIAFLVFLREGLHVIRRFLVENTCTRIDKHLSVKVVSHLLQVDLATFTHEKVGVLHGRIFRSIDGYMRLTSPVVDPAGPETGFLRVLRGGGFSGIAALSRSALRATNSPQVRHNYSGFRVALPVPRS